MSILAFDGFELLNELNDKEFELSIYFILNCGLLKRMDFSEEYINEVDKERRIYYEEAMRDLYTPKTKEEIMKEIWYVQNVEEF